MLSRLLLLGLLIVMGLEVSGQESYRVLFAGGRSYLASENRFSKLQIGQRIEEASELELIGNSKVVLMDNAGRLISLGLAGRYTLTDFSESTPADSSEFFKSIWEEYFRRQDEGQSIQETLLARDAVSAFELSIPSSSQVFGQHVIIEWPHVSASGYELRLINEFGEVLENKTQEEPRVSIDLLQTGLAFKTEVTLQVYRLDNGQRSPLYTLHKLSPPDYEDMDRLLKEHFQGNQLELLLTKAAYFENQWLFADAQSVIQQLKKEHGTLMDNFWKNYLFRNGFYAMSRE